MASIHLNRMSLRQLSLLAGVLVFAASSYGYFCVSPSVVNACTGMTFNSTRNCQGVPCPDLYIVNPPMELAVWVENAPGGSGVINIPNKATCSIDRRRCSGSSCYSSFTWITQVSQSKPGGKCGPPPDEF